jgi:CubicO group peptidase (beta-lactamase class C family)
MKKLIFSALFLFAGFGLAFAQQDKIAAVETGLSGPIHVEGEPFYSLQQRMDYYKVKGLSIAVIVNYQVVWAKGYGWADSARGIRVTPKTLFQGASMSKSLNAIGVLKLVQERHLSLDSDINKYLTSWKFPYDSLSGGKKITIRALLSHTAGLGVDGFAGYTAGSQLPTIPQILDGQKPANSSRVRSLFPPGTKFAYSGGGVVITQLLITDQTGMAYATYMKRAVLEPLRMNNSSFEQPPTDTSNLATGYEGDGKPLAGRYHIYPEEAPAGLWTTPTDMAKYVIETQLAYAGHSKVLDQQMTRLRLTPVIIPVALGAFIEKKDSIIYFDHAGENKGFTCEYYGSLENGNGVVVMINSQHFGIIPEVIGSVARVYGFKGLGNTTFKKQVNVPDSLLKTYCGDYQLAPNVKVHISDEGGVLYAHPDGQPKSRLYAETVNEFLIGELANPVELEFTGGNLVLHQNSKQMIAKRIQ